MDNHVALIKNVIYGEAAVIVLAGVAIAFVYESATSRLRASLDKIRGENETLRTKLAGLKHAEEEVKKLDQKFIKTSSRLTNLQSFTQEIGKTLNVDDVCKKTLKVVVSIFGAEKCCIYLFNEDTGALDARESFGWSEEEKKEKFVVDKEDTGLINRSLETGSVQSTHADDMSAAKAAFEITKTKRIPSVMCAPLLLGDKKVGVINIEKMEGSPGQEEVRLFYYIAILTAMSIENSKLFMKTELLANFDGLTKMYTHRYMQDFLDKELEKSKRYNHPLSIVLTDIDHFKNFNDKYGHQIGDMVLAETAKVLRETVRNIDIAARYGGEEFGIILPDLRGEDAYKRLDNIRKKIENMRYRDRDIEIAITVSSGIATYPELEISGEKELIEYADKALYYANRSGRNKL